MRQENLANKQANFVCAGYDKRQNKINSLSFGYLKTAMRFYENLRFRHQQYGYLKRPDGVIYRRLITTFFITTGIVGFNFFLKVYPQFIDALPYWEERVNYFPVNRQLIMEMYRKNGN